MLTTPTALSHNLQTAGRHHSAELDTRMYARRTEAQQRDENTKASMVNHHIQFNSEQKHMSSVAFVMWSKLTAEKKKSVSPISKTRN